MTEPVEPSTPDPSAGGVRRIGDAERDKAAEYLREHMAAGGSTPLQIVGVETQAALK
jgi:hypothetical protein